MPGDDSKVWNRNWCCWGEPAAHSAVAAHKELFVTARTGQTLPGPFVPSAIGIKVTQQHLGASPRSCCRSWSAGTGCSQCQGGPCHWSPGEPGWAAGPPWRGKGSTLWPAAGRCHTPWEMGAFPFVGWERGAPALSSAGQAEGSVTDTVPGSLDGTGKQNTRLLTHNGCVLHPCQQRSGVWLDTGVWKPGSAWGGDTAGLGDLCPCWGWQSPEISVNVQR